jgi:cell division protein FtsQ
MNAIDLARLASRIAAGAALAVLVLEAAVWAAQRPRFDFHRIEITGELRHVGRAAIRTAVAGRLSGNFFTMRLADTRRAFESIPWVASASVRRVWPDRLVVRLTERRAIGVWSDGRVLSDAGVLFDANPAEAELDGARIEFSGPPQYAADAVARLAAMQPGFEAMHQSVAAVSISERASWTIRTAAGQLIDLGRDDPPGSVARRLAAVVAQYPTVVARLEGVPGRIDARYENGFAAVKP